MKLAFKIIGSVAMILGGAILIAFVCGKLGLPIIINDILGLPLGWLTAKIFLCRE